jgi:hypothetical protein
VDRESAPLTDLEAAVTTHYGNAIASGVPRPLTGGEVWSA